MYRGPFAIYKLREGRIGVYGGVLGLMPKAY